MLYTMQLDRLVIFATGILLHATQTCLSFSNSPRRINHQIPILKQRDLHWTKGLSQTSFQSSTSAPGKHPIVSGLATNLNEDINMPSGTSMESISKMLGSTTSSVVAGTFFIVLAYKRDTFMLTFFIGSILNGIISKVLKKVLKQDRPDGYLADSSIKVKPSDNGMPSSHAMSLGFIITTVSVELALLMNNRFLSCTLCALLWSYVAISLRYRVQSCLHTKEQIWVGLGGGISNALLWRSLATGTNILLPSVNVMNVVSGMLPDSGVMPVQLLIVPAMIGAAVVGSFERRISDWLKNRESKAKTN